MNNTVTATTKTHQRRAIDDGPKGLNEQVA